MLIPHQAAPTLYPVEWMTVLRQSRGRPSGAMRGREEETTAAASPSRYGVSYDTVEMESEEEEEGLRFRRRFLSQIEECPLERELEPEGSRPDFLTDIRFSHPVEDRDFPRTDIR